MSENVDPFKPGYINPHKEGLNHYQEKIANFRNNVRPFLNKPRGGGVQNWVRPPLLGTWPVFSVQVDSSPLAAANVNVQFTPQQAANMVAQANPANLAQVNVAATPANPANLVVGAMPANVVDVEVEFSPTKATSTAVEATPAIPDSLETNAEPVKVSNVEAKKDPVNIGQVTVEASPAVPTSVDSNYYDFNDPFLGLWKYSNTVATGYIVVLDPLAFADAAIPLNYPNGSELEILKVQDYVASNALGVPDMIKTDDGLIGGKEGYQLFDVGDQMTVWTYVEFAELPTAHEYSLYRGQARPPFEVDSVSVSTSPLNLGSVVVDATPAVPDSVEPGWIPEKPASVVSDSSPKAVQIGADASPANVSSVDSNATPLAPDSVLGELENAAPNSPASVTINLYAPQKPAIVIAANNNAVPLKPTAVISQIALPAGKVSSVNAVAAPRTPAIVNSTATPATPSVSAGSIPEKPTSTVVASSPRKPSLAGGDSEPVDPLVVSSRERTSFMPSSISVQASPSKVTSISVGSMPDAVTSTDANSEPKSPTSISSGYVPQKPALTLGEAAPLPPLVARHGLITAPFSPRSVTVFPGVQTGLFPTLPLSVSVVNLSAIPPAKPASTEANAQPRKPSNITGGDLANIAPVKPNSITVLDPSVSGPTPVSVVYAGVLPEKPNSVLAVRGVTKPSSVSVNAQPVAPASVDSDKNPEEPNLVVPEEISAKKPASISVGAQPAMPGCVLAEQVLFQSSDVGRLIVALETKTGRGLTKGNIYTITVVQAVPTFANTDSTEPNGNVGIHIDHKGLQWDFVTDPNWGSVVYDLENDFSTEPLAWFDAADSDTVILNADGVTVDGINDKLGKGHQLYKVEDAKRADYNIASRNDRNTIDFSAQPRTCLRDPVFELGNKNVTIFAAIRMFSFSTYDFPIAFTNATNFTDYTTSQYERLNNQEIALENLGNDSGNSDTNDLLKVSPVFEDGDFFVTRDGIIKDNNYGISRFTGLPYREENTDAGLLISHFDNNRLYDRMHFVGSTLQITGDAIPSAIINQYESSSGYQWPFDRHGLSGIIRGIYETPVGTVATTPNIRPDINLSLLFSTIAGYNNSTSTSSPIYFTNADWERYNHWSLDDLMLRKAYSGRFRKHHDFKHDEWKIIAIEFDRFSKTLTYRVNGTSIIDKEMDLRELNKLRALSVGSYSEFGELIVMPTTHRQKTEYVESYLSKKWDIKLDGSHPYECAVPTGSGPDAESGSYDGGCCIESKGGWVRSLSISTSQLFDLGNGIWQSAFPSSNGVVSSNSLLGGNLNDAQREEVLNNRQTYAEFLYTANSFRNVIYNEVTRSWSYPIYAFVDCEGVKPNFGTASQPKYAYFMPLYVGGSHWVADLDCDGDGYWDASRTGGTHEVRYVYRWIRENMELHDNYGDTGVDDYDADGNQNNYASPPDGNGWDTAEEQEVLAAVASYMSNNQMTADNPPVPSTFFQWNWAKGGCDSLLGTVSDFSGSLDPNFAPFHNIPDDETKGYRLDYLPLVGARGKMINSSNTFFIESVSSTQIVTDTQGTLNLSDRGSSWEMVYTELEDVDSHPSTTTPSAPECVEIYSPPATPPPYSPLNAHCDDRIIILDPNEDSTIDGNENSQKGTVIQRNLCDTYASSAMYGLPYIPAEDANGLSWYQFEMGDDSQMNFSSDFLKTSFYWNTREWFTIIKPNFTASTQNTYPVYTNRRQGFHWHPGEWELDLEIDTSGTSYVCFKTYGSRDVDDLSVGDTVYLKTAFTRNNVTTPVGEYTIQNISNDVVQINGQYVWSMGTVYARKKLSVAISPSDASLVHFRVLNGNMYLSVNNGTEVSTAIPPSMTVMRVGSTARFGKNLGTTEWYGAGQGYLGEQIVAQELTASERSAVLTYLYNKWI